MSCSPCYITHCITAPADCRTGAPGGWQRLWFLNRCDLLGLGFEAVGPEARGRIRDLSLAAGASLKSFAFYKKAGLQLDSTCVEENGYRWDHQALVPLTSRDALTMAVLRQMQGAELVLVGLHRDGRHWLVGGPDEGFSLTNWTDNKGRAPADGALMELTFQLTNTSPQIEFLLSDSVLDPADIDARLALTRQWLADNTYCGGAPPPPLPTQLVLSGNQASIAFRHGAAEAHDLQISLSGMGCTGPFDVRPSPAMVVPRGFAFTFPTGLAQLPSAGTLAITSAGTAGAANYTLLLEAVSANGCISNTLSVEMRVE